jgi:hypothetical protein
VNGNGRHQAATNRAGVGCEFNQSVDHGLGVPPIDLGHLHVAGLSTTLGDSASSPCAAMTLATVVPPTGATHDTSDSSDPFYIGVKPTVTTAPKVIDGVIQQ